MDLYALPPEEFTAARDAAARADRSLKALRRPTVAAWVVNTLVRREPALVEDLVALGGRLAEAQRAGGAQALRELGARRHALVEQLTGAAVALVDRPVSDAVRAEVSATLDAALADPASAEAVRSGQLVRALAFAGFGGVDLQGAVAPVPPAREPGRRRVPSRSPGVGQAEQAALDAAGALDDAVRAAESAGRVQERLQAALDSAQDAEAAAAAAVERARAALEGAERDLLAARARRTEQARELGAAEASSSRAAEQVAQAQAAADAARAALDALRRG